MTDNDPTPAKGLPPKEPSSPEKTAITRAAPVVCLIPRAAEMWMTAVIAVFFPDVFNSAHGAWTWGGPLLAAAFFIWARRWFRTRNIIVSLCSKFFIGASLGETLNKFAHWSMPDIDIALGMFTLLVPLILWAFCESEWGESKPMRRIKAVAAKVNTFIMGS